MGKKRTLSACFLLCCVCGSFSQDILNGLPGKSPKYAVVQPQRIHRATRSIGKDKQTDEFISYSIEINHKKHRLHLQRNRDFLHPDLFSDVRFQKIPVHCYYHGQVEGYPDSMVAVSTCHGLGGVIALEGESFGLEPLPGSTSNEHVLYALSDDHEGAATCGVSNADVSSRNETHDGPRHTVASLLRKKRNLADTSFVELALVVDHLRYVFKQRNETKILEEMVELANLVDGKFKRLNIRVMLVHVEVFTEGNPFSVDDEPGTVLSSFVKWRKESLLPRSKNDMAQFIIGRTEAYGNVLGMAFVGTVCSAANSGGINVFIDGTELSSFSVIVAHEMGHNLGMNHDDSRCTCEGDCIMASASGSMFSTCSGADFEKLVLKGGGTCLKNVPSHSDVVGIAKCGNGLLEEGEQCDCGTPEECKDKCCNAATCTFTRGSVCAAGRCCQNCQLKVAGSPCRTSENSCDLPEFCSGKSAFCPDDTYIMDGLQCQSGAAYCYEGRCQTYDFQCQQLFSDQSGASKADDICFQTANARGNAFGNCGRTVSGYVKCSSENVMCGKVQCTNVDANHPPPGGTVSNQIVNSSKCVNADFNLGPDVLDPAYSNPGSPCAPGKTCVDFRCVDASVLLANLRCDAKTTCHGHGVCNNQGHCHCDLGWGPPSCASSGPGGSTDSGPATIDYSLRNGLLIFFLLVVPLLVLVVLLFLYLFRRDTLDPCLKRRHKSRSTTNRTPAPMNFNVPVHTSTQPPQPPVLRPQYPPQTAGGYPPQTAGGYPPQTAGGYPPQTAGGYPPQTAGGYPLQTAGGYPPQTAGGYPPETEVPGWKYGELDYWKDQDQAPEELQTGVQDPTKPPPPQRQGQGVPRPIPPPKIND